MLDGTDFPAGEGVQVLGAPWDYSQSTLQLHEGSAIGHYRVKMNETRASALGDMVGSIAVVGKAVGEDAAMEPLREKLKHYTHDVTLRAWREGLESLRKKGKLKGVFKTAAQAGAEMLDPTKPRIATTFNMIDKMVLVGDDNQLTFASTNTISRGFIPMVSKNATHDVGFAVARILVNPDNYEGDDIDKQIEAALEKFVAAYNEATELDLGVEEALEAADKVLALQVLYGIGYNKLSGDAVTETDFIQFEQQTQGHLQNVHDADGHHRFVAPNLLL